MYNEEGQCGLYKTLEEGSEIHNQSTITELDFIHTVDTTLSLLFILIASKQLIKGLLITWLGDSFSWRCTDNSLTV